MANAVIIEQPWVNEFGTTNVGDIVMVVTTGYSHNVHVNKAKYVGYIESTKYGKPCRKVKLEVEEYKDVFYYKGTDTRWAFNYDEYRSPEFRDKLEVRKVFSYIRKTTLQRNRIAPISKENQVNLEAVQQFV